MNGTAVDKTRIVSWLLRLALSFSFAFPAVSSLLAPKMWIGFVPPFILEIFPGTLFLFLFSVLDLLVALWLLWGKYTFYAAISAGIILLVITAFNLSAFAIVFRDVSLAAAAGALALLHYSEVRVGSLKRQ